MQRSFLERAPSVSEETVDELQDLLKRKIDLKTGYAEPCTQARVMQQTLRSLDLSDDGVLTKESFRAIMDKMNCGENKLAVDALFHRYDRRGDERVAIKDFADALFGLKRAPNAYPECRDVIKLVRGKLLARGGENGFRGLVRILRTLDGNGSRRLDRSELKSGLQMYGINLSEHELNTLVHYFDTDGNGAIDVTEFVVGLRPVMNDSRVALVRLAYLRLDKNPDGVITFDELRGLYCADKHPSVIKGTKTADEVLKEFGASWNRNGDDVITEQEFLDYYRDISATIDNDEYFELLLRVGWRISGAKGGSKNGATLRVRVTHLDGTQTVETLDSDLGVDSSNAAALAASLRKQGVTDILRVETRF